jgi:ABC-2 type transport system ATP-binding protein
LTPDEGTVQVFGQKPSLASSRKTIGVAPQALALYEEFTARENLAFFGRMYDLSGSKLRERTDWSLKLAGLEDRANDRVATYSGGMKRRLNIAVAMVHDPELILLDEPTVGVDPQSRNFIFEAIEQLRGSGKTILYTTHYMEEAQRLCDQVAIVDHGRLMALDTVEGLITAHGGFSHVHAEVEFSPAGFEWPGTIDESVLHFQSDDPVREISKMYSAGVEFRTLKMERPDLENVFLALTGKSLRD